MSNILPGRCPHGLTPMVCLTCFNAKPATVKNAPKPVDPVVAQVRARSPVEGAPQPSRAAAGNVQMPQPVMVAPAGIVQARAGGGAPQAFDYARDVGTRDKDGVWHPPKRPSLIDTLPRHPDAKR